ncbi:polyprenyl synthetase family protein [Patescibacteria group bacterium]|nr:polyprenyl synthetase family protein [Patescibacteria group bacterium]
MVDLKSELQDKARLIADYILSSPFRLQLMPKYVADGASLYTARGGKMLRPAILMLACEAAGGDSKLALPAAAAIEMSHTWTLVHDDLIDNDDLRRGGPSVHAYYREFNKPKIKDRAELEQYARSMAMLVGDLQQAWAISMINELSDKVDTAVFRYIIHEMTNYWVPRVMSGQALDLDYSKMSFEMVTEEMILEMLARKTASTFGFAGQAGAMIGINKLDKEHPTVKTIQQICLDAGLAFQLRDDILGVVGDEKELGKPIGSDVCEGKKTVIIAHAYRTANADQKKQLLSVLGNEQASETEVMKIHTILKELGSIDYAEALANKYADKARAALECLSDSRAKQLFGQWIDFIVNRVS